MKSLKVKFIAMFLGLALIPIFFPHDHFFPRKIQTMCSEVIDGDTIIAKGRRVRLVYIDAPESKQWDRKDLRPVGEISTRYLKEHCDGKAIEVILYGKDRYGRYLGELLLGGKSLNFQMVKKGMAFIYDYAKFKSPYEKSLYIAAYKNSKASKIGIFQNSVLKPSTYRKKERNQRRKNEKKRNERNSL